MLSRQQVISDFFGPGFIRPFTHWPGSIRDPDTTLSALKLLLRSALARLRILSTAQRVGVLVAAVFYVLAGTLHFIKPEIYLRIVPPYIPWHPAMVGVSGALEILGGLGLLLPGRRRAAAWGLAALLVAVFPANLYMAMHPIEAGAGSIAPAIRWGRLPLQLALIWWLLWCTRPRYVLR
jgi:uncharacterized membrane protein